MRHVLTVIERLPESLGTTWTRTTTFEDGHPTSCQIWADHVITSRLVPAGTVLEELAPAEGVREETLS